MVPHDDSPLSARAQQAIKDGEDAWEQASGGNWNASSWWRMGTALTLLRQQTLHELGINVPRGGPYNEAFASRISDTKFATMEPVTRSNLLFLMEPEIRIVLDGLLQSWKPDVRARRTHPTTLAQHVRKELTPKPEPKPKAAKSEAKATAAPAASDELAKALAENERLRKRVRDLEATAKAAPGHAKIAAATENLQRDLFRMRLERDRLQTQLERASKSEPEQVTFWRNRAAALQQAHDRRDKAAEVAKAAKAKAAKALAEGGGDGDDPRLVAMAKTINDLKAKMKAMREDQKVTGGRMSHKTVGVISMAFHPDGGMPTREELDNAMKVFNQWKADNKDAKRGKS